MACSLRKCRKMISTSPDLASLLHRWEIAEYVSEGFVILGCLGELVADLGSNWLGETRQKRLERWSTILLVAALTVSLKCLVRTNELSGGVIGSLGTMAEEADGKERQLLQTPLLRYHSEKTRYRKQGWRNNPYRGLVFRWFGAGKSNEINGT